MPVEYKKEGKIAVITLNRPEALNAMNPESSAELSKILLDLRDDDNIWVGIITGSGDRAFCAGADVGTTLPRMKKNKGQPWKFEPTPMRGMDLWKPMIAAVNGLALGGGFEIVLACDIRIASEKALFGLPEVTLGLIPGWGGTQRLPRAVPQAIAAEMLFTGKPISAQEAYRVGLVNRVVAPAELMNSAMQMANILCGPAPLAVRTAKQAMYQGLGRSLEEGLMLEYMLEDLVMMSEDYEEGTSAFLSKRKPAWKSK
jgi:enoyl-CoA hydratase/carnithine racemase